MEESPLRWFTAFVSTVWIYFTPGGFLMTSCSLHFSMTSPGFIAERVPTSGCFTLWMVGPKSQGSVYHKFADEFVTWLHLQWVVELVWSSYCTFDPGIHVTPRKLPMLFKIGGYPGNYPQIMKETRGLFSPGWQCVMHIAYDTCMLCFAWFP